MYKRSRSWTREGDPRLANEVGPIKASYRWYVKEEVLDRPHT
jgi:hypothetical protein